MKRQPLSRARVLSAAVELLDAEGLAALSMRKLGERLGVEAMSLYRYVRGKEDLLNGVHARVLGEMPPPPKRGKWQTRLRKVARSFRAVLEAHPNALPLFATRPAIAPASLDSIEACLGILEQAGFSAQESAFAFQSLAGFVIGAAFLHFGAEFDPASAPALDPELHPLLCETYLHVDPEQEFAFGLEVFLAGLERRLPGIVFGHAYPGRSPHALGDSSPRVFDHGFRPPVVSFGVCYRDNAFIGEWLASSSATS